MSRTPWIAALLSLAPSACLPPGGGGGGNRDGGGNVVIPGGDGGTGGQGDGGRGGGRDGGVTGDGGVEGDLGLPDGGFVCVPECEGKVCGPDGCGGTCGVPCEDGLRCIDGMCSGESCPAGTLDCDGVCANLLDDEENCGSCGNACPRQDGVVTACVDAQCYLQCPEMEGQPISADLQNDPANCGVCARECPSAMGGFAVCEGGRCGNPCGDGEVCDGACVDPDDDLENCGRCGNACPDTMTCQAGACVCPGAGEVNLANDPDNCGVCGNRCPVIEGGDRVCDDGECLDACGELTECNQACVDTSTDPNHCGQCDRSCDDVALRDPDVRFWYAEADVALEPQGCEAGGCGFLFGRFWDWLGPALPLTTCEIQCAEIGMRCAAPQRFMSCIDDEGSPVGVNADGVGCAVFNGARDQVALAFGCDDIIPPTEGLSVRKRNSTLCRCDGQAQAVEYPGPGAPVPQAGRYQYTTADYELVVVRVTPAAGGELTFAPDTAGSIEIVDSAGRELASDQDLNFAPAAAANVQGGRTYYVLYRTFPEFSQDIEFQILF